MLRPLQEVRTQDFFGGGGVPVTASCFGGNRDSLAMWQAMGGVSGQRRCLPYLLMTAHTLEKSPKLLMFSASQEFRRENKSSS